MADPTFRRQSEEDMLREIGENARRRIRAIEVQEGKAPRLEGSWAPSELWPGEDYEQINARGKFRLA